MEAILLLVNTIWTTKCGWFFTRPLLPGLYLGSGCRICGSGTRNFKIGWKKMKTLQTMGLNPWMVAKVLPVLFLLNSGRTMAQDAAPEMADALRQDGKIWVVVASIFIIVIGMVLFLLRLEGKVSKLEKDLKSKIKP
jgi:hypothetical protein